MGGGGPVANSRNSRQVELGFARPGVSHTEDNSMIMTEQAASQNPYQDVSMMGQPDQPMQPA